MKAIWKYPLKITGRQTVEMPKGARILTVNMQNNEPMLYALVEIGDGYVYSSGLVDRRVRIYGTGHQHGDDPGEYIGTVTTAAGFVWHVFVEEEDAG